MAEIEIHYPDGLVGYKPLGEDRNFLVGSGETCDLAVDGPDVQKKHFMVRYVAGSWRFDCNKGAEGVAHNGVESRGGRLNPDDELTLLEMTLIFRDGAAPRAVAAAPVAVVAAPASSAIPPEYTEEDYFTPIWKSKSIRWTALALLILGGGGGVAYYGYHSSRATKMFGKAVEDFEAERTTAAIDAFGNFRKDYPDDSREGRARIYLGVARGIAFIQSGNQLPQALEEIQKTMDESEKSTAFREPEMIRAITGPLINIATAAAQKAKDTKSKIDHDSYRLSLAALKQVDRINGREGEFVAKFDAAVKLQQEAALAIQKETQRLASVEKIDKALSEKRPTGVYDEHRKLYSQYPDLRTNPDILTRREKTRKLEQELTVFRPAGDAAAKSTATTAVKGQPTVRRTATADAKTSNRIAPVVAADTLFALDGGSGEVRWWASIGYDPAFQPVVVENAGWLVHRPRDASLALYDEATGKEKWASPLAGNVVRFVSRPTIVQGKVFIAGVDSKDPKAGRLFVYALDSGRFAGSFHFPQPIAGLPVYDPKRRTLLVPGEQMTLYTINPSGNTCTIVQELGHEPSTLAWLPSLAGRFLFTVENRGGAEKTILRCFVLSGDDGLLREKPIAELSKLPGAVVRGREPTLKGQRLFTTTDHDAFEIFDLGGEEDEKPIQLAARNVPAGPSSKNANEISYPVPVDERRSFWTVGRQVRFYELRPGIPEPAVQWKTDLVGPPASPPLLEGDTLVVVARNGDKGTVQVVGIDVQNRKERWRLDLAEPPRAVQKDPSNPNGLLVTMANGQPTAVNISDLDVAKLVQLPPLTLDNRLDAPADFEQIVGWTNGVAQWTGIGGNRFRAFPPGKPAKQFTLPAAAAAAPTVFGNGILTPASDGMLYWIDPLTGTDLAEPFGLPYVEGQPVDYGPATGINDKSVVVVAGLSLVKISLTEKPFRHFVETDRIDLPEAPDPAKIERPQIRTRLAATQLTLVGDRLLLTTGRKLYRLGAADFAIEKNWPLDGLALTPPVRVGDLALFMTNRLELSAFGSADGKAPAEVRWREKLDRNPLGAPQSAGANSFWLAFADGAVCEYGTKDGKPIRTLAAGRPLMDGPWVLGERVVVMAPDGGLAALPSAR